jgi:hypothetical protein
VANKWLEALKAKKNAHNTTTAVREAGPENPSAVGEIDDTPKNPLAKIAKITSKLKKRTKKKQLTPEEEEVHRGQLEKDFPEYVYTEERAREVLEWARQVPEVAIDIETYGRLKRDGLLYTRCQVRMILLHHASTSFFF